LEFALNRSGWDGGIITLLTAIYYPGRVKKMAATGSNLTADTKSLYIFFYKQVTQVRKQAG
jgi:hypothetical protein